MEFVFVIFFVVFIAIFILSSVTIGFGFFRAAKFSRKVFDHVENQLDRELSPAEPAEEMKCEFCGTRTVASDVCPNCGAPIS
jgi:rubrerythrin